MSSSSPDETERRAALALALVEGVGPVRHAELLAEHRTAAATLERWASVSIRERVLGEAEDMLVRARGCGARLVVAGEPAYPAGLSELHAPPSHLWFRGDLSLLGSPCIAIVGTRHPTAYGERVARQLASSLARAGAVVVSGMALGVDGAAHQAALDADGRSIGVLGTGVDVAYPRAHARLHRRLATDGLLISEEPPGARATPGSFPKRNRIIAALSAATIVVEADHDSGALITAGHALELARPVAAVPGPIDSPRSNGTNRLLRDGAIVIAEPADALALLGLSAAPVQGFSGRTPSEREVWSALSRGATDLESLAVACDLPLRECLAAVTALELAGAVECAASGEIRRRN